MATIYQQIMDEFHYRNVAVSERYVPYYIASIGSHVFNYTNKDRNIIMEGGLPWDTRVHQFFVAPPGFMKTYILRQFCENQFSILPGSQIHTVFKEIMTEAGFVGTIKGVDEEDNPIIFPGIAVRERRSIIAIEEFEAVTAAMTAQHSTMLDSAILSALDRGRVTKDLGPGNIDEPTELTVWAASQPMRFNLTSGLGRRFWHHLFIPSMNDMQTIRIARRNSKGIRPNMDRLAGLRKALDAKIQAIEHIEDVAFHDSIYTHFDSLGIIHYEEPLFERIALGVTIMDTNDIRHLTVKITPTLARLFREGYYSRLQLKRGTDVMQVYLLLKYSNGSMRLRELRNRMLDFGVDWRHTMDLLKEMTRIRMIRFKDDSVYLIDYNKDTKEDT